jgi:tRNA/rRNA methyltransferase
MLDNLAIVLFRPKFPENVGAAARACANMGCPNLVLVAPRSWDPGRAAPMATAPGAAILDRAAIHEELEQALAGYGAVYGTTARLGGWRKAVATPAGAAPAIAAGMRQGVRTAVLFGPEDSGLTNEETRVCGTLLTIPTAGSADGHMGKMSSLNLAQAVLVVLYECLKSALDHPDRIEGPGAEPASRPASFEETETLFSAMRDALLAIDYLQPDNPDYWMLPVRRLMARIGLKRSEFTMLMGICRQIKWIAAKARGRE